MQIILYTKAARIGDATRKEMIKAGYVPILVDDVSAVKILPPSIPEASLDAITTAALQTIVDYGGNVASCFGKILATDLCAKRKASNG